MNQDLSPPTIKQRLTPEYFFLIAIALGILLRCLNLGSREFWYDEVLSLLLSSGQKIAYYTPGDTPVTLADFHRLLSLPAEASFFAPVRTIVNLLRGLAGGEPHPPLFYLTQHLWLRLFGNGEAAQRSIGMLLSGGAIVSAYGLGKNLLGHRGGLLLAALFATNPFYLFHSLNLRMYGPVVLWTTLSAWALLEIIKTVGDWSKVPGNQSNDKASSLEPSPHPPYPPLKGGEEKHDQGQIIWTVVLILAVAAGCMTLYLFAFWLIALAAVVLFLDRRRWWQHGLRMGAGVVLAIPWGLWGTRQQLRNADFGRFNAPDGVMAAMLKHLQDVANTLGIQLLWGDWITSLPGVAATVAGAGAIGLLIVASIRVWRQGEKRLLTLALLLGIFPLLLALTIDIASGKYTVGFGWGRSAIYILPGCLLLICVCLHKTPHPWGQVAAAVLLLLYLGISVGDFSFRQRQIFHQIAATVAAAPNTPTLIALNSKAWGHIMRLAYYIPPEMPVKLLAAEAKNLPSSLAKVLTESSQETVPTYQRVMWLDSFNPLWSAPTTPEEKSEIEAVLSSRFQLQNRQHLLGTMNLDEFTVSVYQ
ncbi:MAG TPA: glycosyltransferase family 39 protein [Oscillatoriaceae cyanobacterium M33_DOE_052]|uniref:Glycosyltransferase RgtA/B/C/D-like domain-containing protein n=1 Tax=Planktothricoides sp. SpSt-374 TaxID=2282167 RepID=A0A7C3ZEN2_9CYAN|nr:glycosyltransferase family 39 protein [Oscillatoriaceae cyanobacterium M33_DOE_052]